jgi:hypothetical protein
MGYIFICMCVYICVCVCIYERIYIYIRSRRGLGPDGIYMCVCVYVYIFLYERRREEGKPMRGVSTRLVSWQQPARPFVEWHGMRLCTPWHRSARGDAALQCSHRRSGGEVTPAAPREYS